MSKRGDKAGSVQTHVQPFVIRSSNATVALTSLKDATGNADSNLVKLSCKEYSGPCA
jgi:hypothetical protein